MFAGREGARSKMLCAVDYIFNLLCAFNCLQPMKKFVFSVASRATGQLQIKPSGSGDENASGRKNVLRKLLGIPYRRLKAGFSVCLFVAGVWVKCRRRERLLYVKHFYLTCLLLFSSLENYFRFRTTNVKGKNGSSVSLRWNERFWTFLNIFSDCASD